MTHRIKDVGEIETRFLFDMVVDLAPQIDHGNGPLGTRILFPSKGGTFEGPVVRGIVEPHGGDWTVFRADGGMILDVRLSLTTDDGARIFMTYGGRWIMPGSSQKESDEADSSQRLDPSYSYFRTIPLFETGAQKYLWMNDIVSVGKGYIVEGAVAYKVFQID